ncbi:MAG: hypothetical protein IJZ64_00030 [Ruminococcus sp.]|nr:hypothetical protein [Ruminococcus sp.]
MGKSIDKLHLVKRSEKLSFLEVIGDDGSSTYHRMQGFTNMEFSHNTKEHTRQYVDEDFERTDTVGHSKGVSYEFEHYKDDPALEEIVKITESEATGLDAVRNIVTVDMTTKNLSSGNTYSADATIRPYTIAPGSNGGSTECMTYSGDFKSRGPEEKIKISTMDKDWLTITVPELGAKTVSALSEETTASTISLSKAKEK